MTAWLRRWWFHIWTARRATVPVHLPRPADHQIAVAVVIRKPCGSWHFVHWQPNRVEFMRPFDRFASDWYRPVHAQLQRVVFPQTVEDERLEMEWRGRRDRCDLAPPYWFCSRDRGHDGPCAARPLQGLG